MGSEMGNRILEIGFESRVWLRDYETIRFGRAIIEECIAVIHQQDRIPREFLYGKSGSVHELAIRNYFGIER